MALAVALAALGAPSWVPTPGARTTLLLADGADAASGEATHHSFGPAMLSTRGVRVSDVCCGHAPSRPTPFDELGPTAGVAGALAAGNGSTADGAAMNVASDGTVADASGAVATPSSAAAPDHSRAITVRLPVGVYDAPELAELGFGGGGCCVRVPQDAIAFAFSAEGFDGTSWPVYPGKTSSRCTGESGMGLCSHHWRSLAVLDAPRMSRGAHMGAVVMSYHAPKFAGAVTRLTPGWHSSRTHPGLNATRSIRVPAGLEVWLYRGQSPHPSSLGWVAAEDVMDFTDVNMAQGAHGMLVMPTDAAMLFPQCNYQGAPVVVPFGAHVDVTAAGGAVCRHCVGNLRGGRVQSLVLPAYSRLTLHSREALLGDVLGNFSSVVGAGATAVAGELTCIQKPLTGFTSMALEPLPVPVCDASNNAQAVNHGNCESEPHVFVNAAQVPVDVLSTARGGGLVSLAEGQSRMISMCQNKPFRVAAKDESTMVAATATGTRQIKVHIVRPCRSQVPQPPLTFLTDFGNGEVTINIGTPGRNPSRGGDSHMNFNIDLGALWKPVNSKVRLQRQRLCPVCAGKAGPDEHRHQCPMCLGSGLIIAESNVSAHESFCTFEDLTVHGRTECPMRQTRTRTCPRCDGHGEVVRPGHQCTVCKGKRVVGTTNQMPVKFKAGAAERSQVTLKGMGNEKPFQT